MYLLSVIFNLGCIEQLDKGPNEFPDNPLHDNDGDGLTEQDGDCDDLNNSILGPSTWYLDSDKDGYGDPNQEVVSCLEALLALDDGLSYVVNSDDCNDSDSSIFPNNARYEADDLCVLDSDGDGYGDALPSVSADPGRDCNDNDALVYPGYNEESGELCILDADGDGFGQANPPQPYDSGSDCDDDNAEVNPNAAEDCDGIDNDCNGVIDEYGANATYWYSDTDGDGYGNATASIFSCDQPPNYVSNDSDCDDSNEDAFPNAPEYCDGVDTNCNGILDDSSAIDISIWYIDADSDGFGSASSIEIACEAPSGFVDNLEDCNDLSPDQNPNAVEVCNEVDDDCDSDIDEGVQNTYYIDLDGDGFGQAQDVILACTTPLGAATIGTDCDDTSALIRPDAEEVCNGIDDNCDGEIDINAQGTVVFYLDQDGDGHGTSSDTVTTCPVYDLVTGVSVPPIGYALSPDDCDDSDAGRSPSQDELCTDTIDENCDGNTTLGATDLTVSYADMDGDGQGSSAYSIEVCNIPLGYVSNTDDCNDSDPDVMSGMPLDWEICNGKLDRCEDDDGALSIPLNEQDLDGDGFVSCELDVDPFLWADTSYLILGGGDCDEGDALIYPGAAERCNGVFDDCDDPLYADQDAPDDELDDDGDGHVECEDYDPSTWMGDPLVIGGLDCNDVNANVYTGAASNSPDECTQDINGDGEPDCTLTGIRPNYECDMGVFSSNGMGLDFVLIPAGFDPLGRYEITSDFYMMTTEATEGMWDSIIGLGSSTSLKAMGGLNWHFAAFFANSVGAISGEEACYTCSGVFPLLSCDEAVDPRDCTGYRLPTEAEWEYAARSGTTSDIWTGGGSTLGGTISEDSCSTNIYIDDGETNPLLTDYAWFCASSGYVLNEVAQKQANGFGLYDMHGNALEFTADYSTTSAYNPSGEDPWNGTPFFSRIMRGGSSNGYSSYMTSIYRSPIAPTSNGSQYGVRLVKRADTP